MMGTDSLSNARPRGDERTLKLTEPIPYPQIRPSDMIS